MRFQTPLVPGRLIRRYKRFLADVALPDGREVTAHCPNPGSMMGLAEAGTLCWLEPNDDPKKKLKFGWRIVEAGGARVVVDTGIANRVVGEALAARQVAGLPDYADIRAEVPYGQNSRVDFLLTSEKPVYLEVKSVTLSRQPGLAEFPDSVTARGAKHLRELAEVAQGGAEAVLLFLVSRDDADRVSVAADIDPAYATAMAAARAAGVRVLAQDCVISPEAVGIGQALPVIHS